MLKLKNKLQYAIDLGVDFLLRNTDDDGNILNEQDLHKHCLATLCLVENPRNEQKKVDNALRKIAKNTYSKNNSFFILNAKKEIDNSLTAIAALTFLSVPNLLWGERYLNFLIQQNFQDDYSVKSFTKMHNLTKDKKWLDGTKNYIQKTDDLITLKIEEIEKLSYELMLTQQDGTDSVLAGAFYDEEGNVRIDLSYKNIGTFKKIFCIIENE